MATRQEKDLPDTTRCYKCEFGAVIGGIAFCDFLLIVGRRRGCPGGPDCIEFRKKGKRKLSAPKSRIDYDI